MRQHPAWVLLLAVLLGVATAPALAQPPESEARSRFAAIVHEAEPLLGRYGYPAIAAIVTVDLIGVPMPAASIMVAGTLAADRGQLRLELVATVAFAATILGSQIGYWLGRLGGRRLLDRLPLSVERRHRLEAGYRHWGLLIVVWAPLAEGLRQINGLTAGTLGLRWRYFTLANLVGSAVFVGLWVGGAWLLDEHLAALAFLLHDGRWWLIAGVSLALLGVLAWLWRRRPERAATGVPEGTPPPGSG